MAKEKEQGKQIAISILLWCLGALWRLLLFSFWVANSALIAVLKMLNDHAHRALFKKD